MKWDSCCIAEDKRRWLFAFFIGMAAVLLHEHTLFPCAFPQNTIEGQSFHLYGICANGNSVRSS